MYFQYTALNPENQKLTGTIQAKDEKEARERLNMLSLSILEIKSLGEALALPRAASGKRFSFEATDRRGKKVVGTIEAASDEEAFQKLTAEYLLTVENIYIEGATDEERRKSPEHISDLQAELEKKRAGEAKNEKLARASAEEEKKELAAKIDQTMQTIQAFLNEYGVDMKPEERENIRGYVNQLFRIKDSTNLKHIRQTCENMLSYVEKREVFLKEAKRLQEGATLKVESHTLLEELRKTGLKKEISLFEIIRYLEKTPVIGAAVSRWTDFLLIDDPRAMELRKNIKALRARVWEFLKLGFKSKDPVYKQEMRETVRELSEEKKRLEYELKGLKTQKRMAQLESLKSSREKSFELTQLFVGWLLAFYLLFYFIAFPFQTKNFGFSSSPNIFAFYQIPFLKGILVLFFFFHIALAIREDFLPKKTWSPLLLYPAFGLLYFFFLFNFVI